MNLPNILTEIFNQTVNFLLLIEFQILMMFVMDIVIFNEKKRSSFVLA